MTLARENGEKSFMRLRSVKRQNPRALQAGISLIGSLVRNGPFRPYHGENCKKSHGRLPADAWVIVASHFMYHSQAGAYG